MMLCMQVCLPGYRAGWKADVGRKWATSMRERPKWPSSSRRDSWREAVWGTGICWLLLMSWVSTPVR